MFICDMCKKEFETKRSMNSHKNHHDPIYKEKSIQGSKALQSDLAKSNRAIVLENKKIEAWKSKNDKCLSCNKPLIYPQNKVCSESCYKQYRSDANKRTMTAEGKENIRNGTIRYLKSIGYYDRVFTNVCEECNTNFESRKKSRFCSDPCKDTSRRKKLSKSVKKAFIEGRHKGNEYRNRKNRSYLEKSFITYIEQAFPKLSYTFNHTVKIYDENGKFIKCYYLDFYLPKQNIAIELDGKQHELTIEYDSERDTTIYNQYQTKIIRVSYEEYMNQSKKALIDNILTEEMS